MQDVIFESFCIYRNFDMMFSVSNVGVTTVIGIILLTNALIVVTLSKTKSFSRATKLHISLFTICDGTTGLAIGLRFLLTSNGYILPLSFCKALLGIAAGASTSMLGFYTSMTIECLSMVSLSGLFSGWNFFQPKSWQLTRRGMINSVAIIVLAANSIIWLILSPPPENELNYKCVYTSVAYPIALQVWAAQTFLFFNINIVILIWLVYQLKRSEKRTQALLNRQPKTIQSSIEIQSMPQCSKDNGRISGIPVTNDNLPLNSTSNSPNDDKSQHRNHPI